MIVYIIHRQTTFGEVTDEFDSLSQAAFHIAALERDGARYRLEFRFEDRPKQLELPF
jgi:hypothetical protein